MKRRTFLKSAVIGGGVALSINELVELLAQAKEQAKDRGPLPPRRGERWALGVCDLCPGSCGLVGRVLDDKLVRLQGAPFHPLSRGGICARGAAGAQLLYHPKRLLAPMKRSGKKGDGKFEPISWKDALAELSKHLPAGGAGTMLVAPPAQGLVAALRRAVLPEAHFVEHRPYYDAAGFAPELAMTQGLFTTPRYDLERCDLVLSFDNPLLERSSHPSETTMVFARARAAGRCELIQIEARLSATGKQADTHVAVRAGTEATFALGIAHLLIKEGRLDRAFMDAHVFGFDAWKDDKGVLHEGLAARVLKNFSPRAVAEQTGVGLDVLIDVARRFAAAGRAVAVPSPLPGEQSALTRMAIHCLNAMVGSIDRPGGVLYPSFPPPDPFADDGAAPEPKRAAPVLAGPAGPDAETVLAGTSKAPGTLVIAEADVVGEAVDRTAVARAIDGAGFVVMLASLPNETTKHADLLLPLATHMERFMDAWSTTSGGARLLSIAKPMLQPRGESRAEADLWFELAPQLGRKLPFKSYPELVKAGAEKIYELNQGELFGPEHHEAWLLALEQSGWRPPQIADAESFWTGSLEVGGWWDPVYYPQEWKRVLRTPSGKFELYAQGLARAAADARDPAVKAEHLSPHQTPLAKPSDRYPIALKLYTPATVGGVAGQLSWLRGIAGAHVNVEWNCWVEMSPETAKERKLTAGSRARVSSKSGKLEAVVVHNEAMAPGVAAVPCGLYATDTDPEPGADPLQLLAPYIDPLTGCQRRQTIYVAIEPV